MRKRSKVVLMALMLLSSLFFSACSTGDNLFSDLLIPPTATEEMKAIRDTVAKIEGNDISLVSPVSGTHRSAIFSVASTNDTKTKTVAVYSSGVEKLISVMLLDKSGSKYAETATVSMASTGVDFIEFYDFTGDGVTDMAVGWIVSTGKGISIYDISGIGAAEIYNAQYTAVNFNTLENSSAKTIFTVLRDDKKSTAVGKYIMSVAGELKPVSEVRINGEASGYPSIIQGKAGKYDALFINEISDDGSVNTEIIGFSSNSLVNYTTDGDGALLYKNELKRSGSIVAQDLDGDGQVEFPLPYAQGIATDTADAVRIYKWCTFEPSSDEKTAKFPIKYYAVHNFLERFYIVFPEEWLDKVYVKRDSSWNSLSFYYRGVKSRAEDELLYTVSAMSSDTFQKTAQTAENTLVKLTSERAYVVKFSKDISSKAKRYVPTIEQLQSLFNQSTVKQV